MKVPTPSRGSFGIPEAIHPDTLRRQREEAQTRAKASAEDEVERPGAEGAPKAASYTDDLGVDDDRVEDGYQATGQEEKAEGGEKASEFHPLRNLRKIGVELSAGDLNDLFFRKGHIEKEIKVGFDFETKKPIMATFKTLTPREIDEIDECLAEEIANLQITPRGLEDRRVSWTMAFAMVRMAGRQFVKTHLRKDDTVDSKATAKERKVFTSELSVHLINKAVKLFTIFDSNIKLIMEDPEGTFLEKP